MDIQGKHYRTIWVNPEDNKVVQIINQIKLPHEFAIENLKNVNDFEVAIRDMYVTAQNFALAPISTKPVGYTDYILKITKTGGNAPITDGSHSKTIPSGGGTITIVTTNGIITSIS